MERSYLNEIQYQSDIAPRKCFLAILGVYITENGDYIYYCSIGTSSLYEEVFSQPQDIRYMDIMISKDNPNTLIKLDERFNSALVSHYVDFTNSLSYLSLKDVRDSLLQYHNNTVLKDPSFKFLTEKIEPLNAGMFLHFLRIPIQYKFNFTISHDEYYRLRNWGQA